MTFEKIIVHANCPDGLASAMILQVAYPCIPIEFVQYGTPEHKQTPCKALFCDFSPPKENWQDWKAAGAVVLDHHVTQKDIVDQFGPPSVYADEPGRSGAVLAYEHIVGLAESPDVLPDNIDAIRTFARIAGIRDTWQRNDPGFRESCEQACALMFYGESLLTGHHPYLTVDQMNVGAIIYEKQLVRARKIAIKGEMHPYGKHRVLLFNDGGDYRATSDVAEQCRELDRHVDIVAGFWYELDGSLVFSLRAVGDADVSAIATANGGGGHRAAAGFKRGHHDGCPEDALAHAIDKVVL